MNKAMMCAAAATIGLAGCAMMDGGSALPDAAMTSAQADIRDASGSPRGTATATQIGDSIRVKIDAMNMAAGAYGAHVHMTGRCDGPAFTSAGGHWNPTNRQHGKDNPAGMHMGDLPNLLVGTDGRGSMEITIPNAWIGGGGARLLDADGAAVVIHAAPDDYRTDPSGNSGARIACGVMG